MGTSVYKKYPSLSTFNGNRVLNLGCGFAKFAAKNVVNLDKFGCCEPDVVWDLEKTPLPFEDQSFDHIIANHVFEHLHNWWECFEECSRILKVGGRMDVYVPGEGSDSQLGYRDHVAMVNNCSFYGVGNSMGRYNNAWCFENGDSPAAVLDCEGEIKIMDKGLFMGLMPKPIKLWIATHLRNVVVENHFRFRKMRHASTNCSKAV